MTLSETLNAHIWATNIAPAIYLNGNLLFVAGLAIVLAHNLWTFRWPVIVTLTGWFALFLGLFRMFAPDVFLAGVHNAPPMMLVAPPMFFCAIGLYLTIRAFGRD